MQRRKFLSSAVAIVTVLSGCGSDDSGGNKSDTPSDSQPTATKTQTVMETQATTKTRSPEPTESSQDSLEVLRTRIEEGGVTVTAAKRDGDQINLTYLTLEDTQAGLSEEIGYVTGVYTRSVKEGEEASRMDVTIVDAEESKIGSFHIERDWSVQYNNDEISGEEITIKVLKTLESDKIE